jgi:autonomous glycyl radical cofactor GrcA
VAAHLRRVLETEVELVHGHYGEFKVLVDDEVVVDGGAKVVVGIMPSRRTVEDAVRARIGRREP